MAAFCRGQRKVMRLSSNEQIKKFKWSAFEGHLSGEEPAELNILSSPEKIMGGIL